VKSLKDIKAQYRAAAEVSTMSAAAAEQSKSPPAVLHTEASPGDLALEPIRRTHCYACGVPVQPPDPLIQVLDFERWQRAHPPMFRWSQLHLARLLQRMSFGDWIAARFAQSVEVVRPDGSRYIHCQSDA
jgi:hypothetical protein